MTLTFFSQNSDLIQTSGTFFSQRSVLEQINKHFLARVLFQNKQMQLFSVRVPFWNKQTQLFLIRVPFRKKLVEFCLARVPFRNKLVKLFFQSSVSEGFLGTHGFIVSETIFLLHSESLVRTQKIIVSIIEISFLRFSKTCFYIRNQSLHQIFYYPLFVKIHLRI